MMSSPRYQGVWPNNIELWPRGGKNRVKEHYEPDYELVIDRARAYGVKGFLFINGYLKDVEKSIELCKKTKNAYMTIGCSPSRAHDVFEQELWGKIFPLRENISKDDKQVLLDAYFTRMRELIKED